MTVQTLIALGEREREGWREYYEGRERQNAMRNKQAEWKRQKTD